MKFNLKHKFNAITIIACEYKFIFNEIIFLFQINRHKLNI